MSDDSTPSAQPAPTREALPPTVHWVGGVDGHLELLDQTQLPHVREVLQLRSVESVIDAIRRLCVRGAPAIGVAAGYGLVLGVAADGLRTAAARSDTAAKTPPAGIEAATREVAARLFAARPTAVNLRWALDRCVAAIAAEPSLDRLFREACAIHADEEAMARSMGEHGKVLVPTDGTVLTHCNTGRLATCGDGTALAPLFAAHRDGVPFRVLADETRPLLQGARLTALELHTAGIPVDVIADSAAAGLIAQGQVQLVLVGADRIASNGDVANKVGTYGLALACQAHKVPFYVVAPMSTFDLDIRDGSQIPIEQRDANEVTALHGQCLTPVGVGARNPAFDVTPAALLTGIVTDLGILRAPLPAAIKALVASSR